MRNGLFLAVLLMATVTLAQSNDEPAGLEERLASEHQKLPGLVFDLFYAVKDSLDYGAVDEDAAPAEELLGYRRVTAELLTAFEVDWEIETYRVSGDDYELIVRSRSDGTARYKATRMRRYEWCSDRWNDLGGYLYF